MHRFAVILTHNRPELLAETWQAIGPQVDMVLVVDNASDPPVEQAALSGADWRTAVIHVPDQPPNLTHLWNVGLGAARLIYGERRSEPWPAVAMLCDDAPPPAGWFEAVRNAMLATGAVAGCSAPEGSGWFGEPRVKREPDRDIMGRMPGWAWVMGLDSPIRPDEQFEWWFGDTDVDWQARSAGGMVMIGTHPVPNRRPNDFSGRPEQSAQIAADCSRFAAKYGSLPWP